MSAGWSAQVILAGIAQTQKSFSANVSENSRCDVRAERVEDDDETVRSAVGSEALREQLDVSTHH